MNTKLLDNFITDVLLRPNYRRYNINGAPYFIGSPVIVLNNPNCDESFNSDFIGMKGHVVFYEYDCGCGQTFPNDPMIGVLFSNKKIGEFWKEEIMLI